MESSQHDHEVAETEEPSITISIKNYQSLTKHGIVDILQDVHVDVAALASKRHKLQPVNLIVLVVQARVIGRLIVAESQVTLTPGHPEADGIATHGDEFIRVGLGHRFLFAVFVEICDLAAAEFFYGANFCTERKHNMYTMSPSPLYPW